MVIILVVHDSCDTNIMTSMTQNLINCNANDALRQISQAEYGDHQLLGLLVYLKNVYVVALRVLLLIPSSVHDLKNIIEFFIQLIHPCFVSFIVL